MICSGCGLENTRIGQRKCYDCHAKYMREWRKTHPLNKIQRKKANARWYAKVYRKRGKLIAQPCEVCGNTNVQMHHEDYSKPLEVTWLCKKHHLHHHGMTIRKITDTIASGTYG